MSNLAPIWQAQIDSLLAIMSEEGNGDHVYNNTRATIGYVSNAERLRVISVLDFDSPPPLNLVELGSQGAYLVHLGQNGDAWRLANPIVGVKGRALSNLTKLKLVLLNAEPLMSGNEPLELSRACFIGLLRARWLVTGCLYPTREERSVTYDEVTVVDATDELVVATSIAAVQAIVEYQAIFAYLVSDAGQAMSKFVVGNAEIIWNTSEHVVRTRGHHYRAEYDTLIRTAYKSASSGNLDWPNEYSLVDAMRTAIHPFGLKALVTIAYKNIWSGTVGNGLIKRITGASNGFACATTAYAGFSMISSEPWFAVWSNSYTRQIELVTAFSQEMLNDRYSFHDSASLYGLAPRRSITIDQVTYQMSDVENAVSAVAPVLQGFIQWSKDSARRSGGATFSFANAKVLEKRASSNPTMVAKMVALLDATIKHISDAETTSASIKEAFPELN